MDSEPFEVQSMQGFYSWQPDFDDPTGVEFGASDALRTYPTYPPMVAERTDPFRNAGSPVILASYHGAIEAVVIAVRKDSTAFAVVDLLLDPGFAFAAAFVPVDP